jgi:hypothetical protein
LCLDNQISVRVKARHLDLLRCTSNYVHLGLILPHAFRAILQSLNPSGEEGDDDLWGDNWRRFLTDLGVAAEAEDPDDADAFEEWVETAVKAFSDGKKFAERVKLFGNPEVSDA